MILNRPTTLTFVVAICTWQLATAPTIAVAGITIEKAAMLDQTLATSTQIGYADAALPVYFVADASTDCESGGLTYSWEFGDGTSATGQCASHVYGECE